MDFSAGFLDLTPEQLRRVTEGIHQAIAKSFEADGAPMKNAEVGRRDAEIRRRFQMCEHIFRQLRGDLHWGVERIVDHLPIYLRAELSGQSWEPDQRTIWVAQDGA